jgi:mitofilin
MQENEAELKLEKLEEFTKAVLAASIASEKATQLEKMAEANLHVRYLLKSHRIDTAAC